MPVVCGDMKTLFSLAVAGIVGFFALTSDAAPICQQVKFKGQVAEQKTDAKGNTVIHRPYVIKTICYGN